MRKKTIFSNVILSNLHLARLIVLIGRYLANAINIVADLGRSGGEFNTKLIYCISFFQPIIYILKIYSE